MIRLLILIAVIWLLYRAWSGFRRLAGKNGSMPREAEKMVRCKTCDLYVPQNQAVQGEDGWFCCKAHKENNPG